jgi:predicted acylesterase/phospholipase RssA
MSSYDTLILCGGGVKGILLLGALDYLSEQGYLNNVTKYVGTSIGSIMCYLIAIGYKPTDLITHLCVHKHDNFEFFDVLAMVNGKGAIGYGSVQEQLEKLTIDKVGKFITLGELKTKYNKKLVCVTYNVTDRKIEYISADNNPDMTCLTAVRMSSNLPFIFEKFKYMDKYYIDGGIVDNFPIDINVDENEKVMGLVTIDNKERYIKDQDKFLEYAYSIINIPMSELTNIKIDKYRNDKRYTILEIENKSDLRVFDFGLSNTEKLNMFSKGYRKAKRFFNLNDSEKC